MAATLPYRSDQGIFGIRYPKEWMAQDRAPAAAVYASEEGGAVEIVERDMLTQGLGRIDQAEYANQVLDRLSATAPGFKLLAVEPFETAAGPTAEIITYNDLDGRENALRYFTCTKSVKPSLRPTVRPDALSCAGAADSRFVPQLHDGNREIAHFAAERRGCGKMAQLTAGQRSRTMQPHEIYSLRDETS